MHFSLSTDFSVWHGWAAGLRQPSERHSIKGLAAKSRSPWIFQAPYSTKRCSCYSIWKLESDKFVIGAVGDCVSWKDDPHFILDGWCSWCRFRKLTLVKSCKFNDEKLIYYPIFFGFLLLYIGRSCFVLDSDHEDSAESESEEEDEEEGTSSEEEVRC